MALTVAGGIGAVKYRHLPDAVPWFFMTISGYMLIYRTFIAKSRLSFLYTPAVLLSLGWIALKHLEALWEKGSLLLALFQFLLVFMATIAAFTHQRIYRRFNPVTTRGLEIYTKASPIKKSVWQRFKELRCKKIELVVFDLGEEIEYKNK